MHLIMDGHLDLAMNALEWNRDLTLPVYEIRKQEAGMASGKSTPESIQVILQLMADNIDHIFKIAGNSDHAAIGSDLYGAFGTEQCPSDIDTITDLQKLPKILQARVYKDIEIVNIMSGNWIGFLKKNWKF